MPPYAFTAHEATWKLDQNEASTDLDPESKRRILDRIQHVDWHRYPEMHPDRLAAKIAERDGWDRDGVVVAAGSNVLIQALAIVAGLGRKVVVPTPTFSVYEGQARALGIPVHGVPLLAPDFSLDVDGLTEAMGGAGGGVTFLADPAAPTGNRHDDARMHAVLDAASAHDVLAVVDEAYWPFDGRHRLEAVRADPNVVSLRTFSKSDALGGVRIGYALAHPEVATNLKKVLLPFSVSSMQAIVAEATLDDAQVRAARAERIVQARSERNRIVDRLTVLPGVQPFPSVTNFVTFRTHDARAVHTGLAQRGVLVRRQDHLPGLAGCLRVSIGEPAANDAFLEALHATLHATTSAEEGTA